MKPAEKFMKLTSGEQAFAVLAGGYLLGWDLADGAIAKLEQIECKTSTTPKGTELNCPNWAKPTELGGGSAILIATTFATAALIKMFKNQP